MQRHGRILNTEGLAQHWERIDLTVALLVQYLALDGPILWLSQVHMCNLFVLSAWLLSSQLINFSERQCALVSAVHSQIQKDRLSSQQPPRNSKENIPGQSLIPSFLVYPLKRNVHEYCLCQNGGAVTHECGYSTIKNVS